MQYFFSKLLGKWKKSIEHSLKKLCCSSDLIQGFSLEERWLKHVKHIKISHKAQKMGFPPSAISGGGGFPTFSLIPK